MDINNILKGINCSCGKEHHCDIEYVYIEKDAISKITEICKDNKTISLNTESFIHYESGS